jgi:hypothetical protein
MTIAFPTNDDKGLQATRIDECKNASFFTVVSVNEKGGITSVISVSCTQIKEMDIDYVVLSKNDNTIECTKVFVDTNSPNVDKALVKVLQENLFKKSA